MKGVLFNVVEDVVVGLKGPDLWDDLIDAAGVDGVYTALGSYPDEEMLAIVQAASDALETPVPDVLRLVGRLAFNGLHERYPHSLEDHTNATDFLQAVESHIHPEVQKLYPDAELPTFEFQTFDDGTLRMIYRSKRGLAALAEGLVHGMAEHFGEAATVVEIEPDEPVGGSVFDITFS